MGVRGGGASSRGERTVRLHNKGMDINEKALRMLKHMRRQLWMQGSRDVSVHNAAISIGVKPEESEFDGLLEELLRGGYIEPYPSPQPYRARFVPTQRFGNSRSRRGG